jgi:hypothetical protein
MTHRPALALAAVLLAPLVAPSGAAGADTQPQAAAEAAADAEAPAGCPLHAQHMAAAAAGGAAHSHHADLQARGDRHMGFSQDATTHRFAIAADGGAVEVTANDPGDEGTIEQVRKHLRHVAAAFADGDFSIPEAVHAQAPPGSGAMAAAGDGIAYAYSDLPAGGRVRLTARTDAALAAVHEFLRFQIADHGTGDPTSVPEP